MREKLNTVRFLLGKITSLNPMVYLTNGLYAIVSTLEFILAMYIPTIVIYLLTGDREKENVIYFIIGLLTVVLILAISGKVLKYFCTIQNTIFNNRIFSEISFKIMSCRFSKVEDPKFIDKKEEALFPITSQGSIENLFWTLPNLIKSWLILVSVLSILSINEPLLMILSIGCAVISFYLSKRFIKQEGEFAKNSIKANKEYVYYLRTMQSSSIAKDTRVYGMQPYFYDKLGKIFQRFTQSSTLLYRIREYRQLINQVISILLMISTYTYLIYRFMTSTMDIGIFILLINANIHFNRQLTVFSSELLQMNQHIVYLNPLKELYDMFEDNIDTSSLELKESIKEIEFRNVTFTYPNSEKKVLDNCSFVLKNHMNLSIVGHNGSGKTTMIKLITRLYKPDSGEILVNGKNINEYNEASYLSQLSVVFQDFKIFDYSIKENIIFDGKEESELLEYAVENSKLKVDTDKLKDGLDTKVVYWNHKDDGGIRLSKGQEQKLAIARNIYHNGSLLILDEPTASLDPVAEEEVYENFRGVTEGKLSIFISHRLSSCRFSDIIIYLENGRVAEVGSHEELIRSQGKYAELFQLQASNYVVS